MNDKLISPAEAAKLLNVTKQTLINWDRDGKIKCVRTAGGHRRFFLPDVLSRITVHPDDREQSEHRRRRICYCRVSSFGQKSDLARQAEFFRDKYPDHEVISDIGSGLNFKRKGFNTVLDSALTGNLEEVVVTHADRLCRFSFELIKRIIERTDGKIVVLDQTETSPEKELVNDLVSIVTVFSSRLYGLRSHSIKDQIRDHAKDPENPNLPRPERNSDVAVVV